MEQAITGRETPQARPNAILLIDDIQKPRQTKGKKRPLGGNREHFVVLELPGNKYIGNILIFAQERKMQQDFNGFGIGCHDD